MTIHACPTCGSTRCQAFFHLSGVPVNSCLLFDDPLQARGVDVGDIDLAYCPDCTFIFNAAWKAERTTYSDKYEETQGFSPKFNAFHHQLAEELIGRYDLVGKEIVEIGCGKGEFLSMLCQMGGNRGVGYDPSFVPERSSHGLDIAVHREFFTETTVQAAPDLVCCKMTLEHIFQTGKFVRAVRRIASAERGTVVFFQVPDVRRILAEGAFWDVYYEHCCYFSPASLEYLFRSCGFEILRTTSGFDDQYLTVEARPIAKPTGSNDVTAGQAMEIASGVAKFASVAARNVAEWTARIAAVADAEGRTVLWGSGSKAVAFLAATETHEQVGYLVDINPYRHGKFVPGTGIEIVAPEFLASYRPDLVIAMNPIYREEISRDLDRLGCNNASLCAVGEAADIGVAAPAAASSAARAPSAAK